MGSATATAPAPLPATIAPPHLAHFEFLTDPFVIGPLSVVAFVVVVFAGLARLSAERRRRRHLESEVALHTRFQSQQKRTHERLETALQATKAGLWDIGSPGDPPYVSPRIFALLGMDRAQRPTLRAALRALDPADRPVLLAAIRSLDRTTPSFEVEVRVLPAAPTDGPVDHGAPRDGPDTPDRAVSSSPAVLPPRPATTRTRWLRLTGSAIYGDRGPAIRVAGAVTDVSDRREAEQQRNEVETQLRRSQRLEAVGTLAAGVAHDLTTLLTSVEHISDRLGDPMDDAGRTTSQRHLRHLVRQGRTLTKGLLTVARKEPPRRTNLDLVRLVQESLGVLDELLPSSIDCRLIVETDRPIHIHADPDQIEQVLINLIVNARDAMPGGGSLRVAMAELSPGDDLSDAESMSPHGLASLAVEDDGTGMEPAIVERATDPFFSTKSRARGSGLGLSIVQSIVADHDGTLAIHSQVGHGTRVEVLFPLVAPGPTAPAMPPITTILPIGTPTVVLTEPNAQVRGLLDSILTAAGADIIVAPDPDEAVVIATSQPEVDAIVLNGSTASAVRTAFEAIRAHRPDVAVVLAGTAKIDVDDDRAVTIQTPYRPSDLLQRLSELLAPSPAGMEPSDA